MGIINIALFCFSFFSPCLACEQEPKQYFPFLIVCPKMEAVMKVGFDTWSIIAMLQTTEAEDRTKDAQPKSVFSVKCQNGWKLHCSLSWSWSCKITTSLLHHIQWICNGPKKNIRLDPGRECDAEYVRVGT